MIPISDISKIARRWVEITPLRSEQYEFGINNPKHDWRSETSNSERQWESSLGVAGIEDRFEKGVSKAGTDKWQRKALDLGVLRWGPGVAKSQSAYEVGFAPYVDVLERTALGPRYARGDMRNLERVKRVTEALHQTKLDLRKAGAV